MIRQYDVTVNQQISELEREAQLRRQLYPGWVRAKRLSGETATLQLARLNAAAETLRGYAWLEEYANQACALAGLEQRGPEAISYLLGIATAWLGRQREEVQGEPPSQ